MRRGSSSFCACVDLQLPHRVDVTDLALSDVVDCFEILEADPVLGEAHRLLPHEF